MFFRYQIYNGLVVGVSEGAIFSDGVIQSVIEIPNFEEKIDLRESWIVEPDKEIVRLATREEILRFPQDNAEIQKHIEKIQTLSRFALDKKLITTIVESILEELDIPLKDPVRIITNIESKLSA